MGILIRLQLRIIFSSTCSLARNLSTSLQALHEKVTNPNNEFIFSHFTCWTRINKKSSNIPEQQASSRRNTFHTVSFHLFRILSRDDPASVKGPETVIEHMSPNNPLYIS